MIAWYSRDKSSFNRSISCWRVILLSPFCRVAMPRPPYASLAYSPANHVPPETAWEGEAAAEPKAPRRHGSAGASPSHRTWLSRSFALPPVALHSVLHVSTIQVCDDASAPLVGPALMMTGSPGFSFNVDCPT